MRRDIQPPQNSGKLINVEDLEIPKGKDVLLVLGSEGEGVSRTISRLADKKIILPPSFETDQNDIYLKEPFGYVRKKQIQY